MAAREGAVGSRLRGALLVEDMLRRVGQAAAVFESRWTMRALARVDLGLCAAVEEQQSLFHEMILTGDDVAITAHGEAMCRGWAAAVVCMEKNNEPDDAYLLGFDVRTGTRIAIAQQRAAQTRVRELHGEVVVFLTPDEVAAMFAGLQSVAQVKALWPGAEIVRVERFPDLEAQGDV